jgi:hypothetical protein
VNRFAPVASVLALSLLFSGCAFGYNRVLFVTKTNAGFEATSTPPTIQLDIARTEGVIAPQFQNGAKLPVMASFRFENDGFFAPAVGSAFTTGDAALTMAGLYADRTPGDWQTRMLLLAQPTSPTDSTLSLRAAPTLPKVFGLFPLTFQESDVRPVFFGTDTSLGIKIAWSGATGEFPDSARFGYNRTELALVPIAMEPAPTGDFKLRMSSLMATIDAGVREIGTAARPGVNFELVQYFATGRAATLLAMQQDVRKAMLARLDPHMEERKRKFDELSPEHKQVAVSFLPTLYGTLATAAPTEPLAQTLVARMDAVVPPAIATATAFDVTPYVYARPTLRDDRLLPPLLAQPFPRFLQVRAQLAESVAHLGAALADPGFTTFQNAPVTAATRDALQKDFAALKGRLAEVDRRIDDNRTVFRDAFEYFYR